MDARVGNAVTAQASPWPCDNGPVLIRTADVQPERVRWFWEGRIPAGKVTTFDGDPGLGKSTVMLDLSARASTASSFPDGFRPEAPVSTILLSAEDGMADTIVPRLRAHGADLERVQVLEAVRTEDAPLGRAWSLPGDIEFLKIAIEQIQAGLVVIDPLVAYLHGSVNSHRDQDVRRALHPLKRVAEETGAAIIIVRHLNKSGAPNAIYRGGGSIGIIGAARAGLIVAADPGDETRSRRILADSKQNLGPSGTAALAYHLENDEQHGCGRVVWEGTSMHTSSTLLALPVGDGERTALDEAVSFLEDLLSSGPVAVREVERCAKEAGVQSRTLRRAKERLGVRSVKNGAGAWSWELPLSEGC